MGMRQEGPGIRKRVSIKDIARLANVSHPTVSRALHGSRLVSAETADRIRRIAAENGYLPSAVARSLVTSRTNTIGVVVTSIADPFVAEVVSGLEEAAHAGGVFVLLAESGADPERERAIVRAFEERRLDGIVVLDSKLDAPAASPHAGARIPVALLNSYLPDEAGYAICIADLEAGTMVAIHLLGLGHRRVAYIGNCSGNRANAERLRGYRQTLETAGWPLAAARVVHSDGSPEGGRLAVEQLLALDPPPTAVFCYNDMTAIGALRGLRARGLDVPEDCSLVGFDDVLMARYTDPPLTTVRQPMPEMGRLALNALQRLRDGVDSGPALRLSGVLISRGSTGPPPLCDGSLSEVGGREAAGSSRRAQVARTTN